MGVGTKQTTSPPEMYGGQHYSVAGGHILRGQMPLSEQARTPIREVIDAPPAARGRGKYSTKDSAGRLHSPGPSPGGHGGVLIQHHEVQPLAAQAVVVVGPRKAIVPPSTSSMRRSVSLGGSAHQRRVMAFSGFQAIRLACRYVGATYQAARPAPSRPGTVP